MKVNVIIVSLFKHTPYKIPYIPQKILILKTMNQSRLIKYILLSGMVITTSVMTIKSKSSGLSAAYTGAPSETTCTSCHSTYSVQTSGTNHNKIQLKGNFTSGGYIPDSTYKITVTYKESGKSRFGFQVTALKDQSGSYPTPAGTFTSKDSRTSTFSQTAGTTTRYYIEHTSTGTSSVSTDSVSYVFEWKAPSNNLGNIKFYLVLNVANNNNNDQGDYIYTKNFTISPATSLPVAKAKISDTFYCSNTPINFLGTSTNSATGYSWKFPGGSITTSNLQNPSVSYTSTGTKMAILETKNAKGKSIPDTLYFNVIQGATSPVLTPSSGPITICTGDSSQLKVSAAANHSYQWSPNGQKTTSIYIKQPNSYVVTAINSNGCKKTSAPIQLIVNQRPQFQYSLNHSTDSICKSTPLLVSFKNTNGYSDSYSINNAKNFFSKDSILKYNLNLGFNFMSFYSKSKNGCVSYPQKKTLIGCDSAPAPIISVINKSTNGFTFSWTNVNYALEYFISLDSGKTWNNPTSGKLSTFENIQVKSIGEKRSILVYANTQKFCGTSKMASSVGQALGCNDIPYSIVPQKSKPCFGDSLKITITGLYALRPFKIDFNGNQLRDSITTVFAEKSRDFKVSILDSNNILCGTTDKTILITVDSGKIPVTSIDPSNLVFCGGLTNATLNFSVSNIKSGDSLFYEANATQKYLGKSNPFSINIQKSVPFKIYLKNSNGCTNQSNPFIGDFRNKLDASFDHSYLTAYNYKFKASDTTLYSKWYLSDAGAVTDSFVGFNQSLNLSQYADKVINIKHLIIDSIQNPNQCSDTASKNIQVLNYSGVINIPTVELRISPNPISKGEILQIYTQDKIQSVNLLSIEGRLVSKLKVNRSNQVEMIQNISAATYILEVNTNRGNYKQKININ